jgi:hypothetical protein
MKKLRIDSQFVAWTLLAFSMAGSSWAASPTVTPTPTSTPTPLPRLFGGFGRTVSTPAAAGATGQSLADVVRAADTARSKEAPEKKAGVKIDNTTLVTDPTKGKLTTAQPPPGGPARPAATPAPASRAQIAPTKTAVPVPSAPSADELTWREAARKARKRVEDARQRVAELDAAAHKLENDFYAWDDGQYRDRVIKPAWEKTKEELEAARKELADAEKDLADLPEKARRAGALPGWLRE